MMTLLHTVRNDVINVVNINKYQKQKKCLNFRKILLLFFSVPKINYEG